MTAPGSPEREGAVGSGVGPGAEPPFGNYFVAAYPPFERWQPEAVGAYRDALATQVADPAASPYILYLHVPFCAERCRYCYYLSHDDRGGEIDAYLEALAGEARLLAAAPALAGRRPGIVYVGGGTPSLLSPRRLERLFADLAAALPWEGASEVTFECAPRSVTAAKAGLLRAAGVTRLSLGVQHLDDEVLARSGRIHRVADVAAAWEAVSAAGFPETNLDLMVGLPGESEATLARTLDGAIGMGPDSVTVYQLEIPYNTPLFRDLRAGRETPGASWEDKHARLEAAFARLGAAGYRPISAYAVVRDPARHAFLYQREQYRGMDLVALGVSAFSYLQGVHHQNAARMDAYLGALAEGRLPWGRAYALSPDERLVRTWVLQLKLGAVDAAALGRRFGVDLLARFAAPLADFQGRGWLRVTPAGEVTLTARGVPRVDRMLPAFYLPRHRPPEGS